MFFFPLQVYENAKKSGNLTHCANANKVFWRQLLFLGFKKVWHRILFQTPPCAIVHQEKLQVSLAAIFPSFVTWMPSQMTWLSNGGFQGRWKTVKNKWFRNMVPLWVIVLSPMRTLVQFIARLVTKWGGKINLACLTFTQEVKISIIITPTVVKIVYDQNRKRKFLRVIEGFENRKKFYQRTNWHNKIL